MNSFVGKKNNSNGLYRKNVLLEFGMDHCKYEIMLIRAMPGDIVPRMDIRPKKFFLCLYFECMQISAKK